MRKSNEKEKKSWKFGWWSKREIAYKWSEKETIRENVNGEAKQKVCKAAQKRRRKFVKILMMKPRRNYVDAIRKEETICERLDDEVKEKLRKKWSKKKSNW